MADINCKIELELSELLMIKRALETEIRWFDDLKQEYKKEFEEEKKEFQSALRKIKKICENPRNWEVKK